MTQNVKCPKTDESKRVTLFLEDESKMSHQDGCFSNSKNKRAIYDYFRMCPSLPYFQNQGIILFINDSESEFLDF